MVEWRKRYRRRARNRGMTQYRSVLAVKMLIQTDGASGGRNGSSRTEKEKEISVGRKKTAYCMESRGGDTGDLRAGRRDIADCRPQTAGGSRARSDQIQQRTSLCGFGDSTLRRTGTMGVFGRRTGTCDSRGNQWVLYGRTGVKRLLELRLGKQ